MVSPLNTGPNAGMVSPLNAGPNAGMVSPLNAGPNAGMVSPMNMGPNAGMISPLNAGPNAGMVSPMNVGPNASMVWPQNVGPNASMVAPMSTGPDTGYGYGYSYAGGGYPSYSPYPNWPQTAGVQDQTDCGCKGNRVEESVEDVPVPSTVKVAKQNPPRKNTKKAVIRTVSTRSSKPKRSGNYPWINR
jgi:hypothetical protein